MQDITHYMRDICGVYLLYREGKVVYIGKSTHVPSRVRVHARSNKIKFDKVMVVYCLTPELDGLEHRLIAEHWPDFNNSNERPGQYPRRTYYSPSNARRLDLEALGLKPRSSR